MGYTPEPIAVPGNGPPITVRTKCPTGLLQGTMARAIKLLRTGTSSRSNLNLDSCPSTATPGNDLAVREAQQTAGLTPYSTASDMAQNNLFSVSDKFVLDRSAVSRNLSDTENKL